jgi:hypothetical protein
MQNYYLPKIEENLDWSAHDAPDLLADDIRQFFASLR